MAFGRGMILWGGCDAARALYWFVGDYGWGWLLRTAVGKAP